MVNFYQCLSLKFQYNQCLSLKFQPCCQATVKVTWSSATTPLKGVEKSSSMNSDGLVFLYAILLQIVVLRCSGKTY